MASRLFCLTLKPAVTPAAQGVRQFGTSPFMTRQLAAPFMAASRSDLEKRTVGQLQAVRHDSGIAAIGCGLCIVGVGSSAQGLGTLFSGYVASIARNPSVSAELMRATLMGMAFIELFGIGSFGMGVYCLS
eukprot:GHVN01001472.1.p1 GENE.GHVN01001472.1~~GHVN01001472.1.p1  ORF type:complete len:131 (+),score=8.30 GHVN01001472.1:492-884(+)